MHAALVHSLLVAFAIHDVMAQGNVTVLLPPSETNLIDSGTTLGVGSDGRTTYVLNDPNFTEGLNHTKTIAEGSTDLILPSGSFALDDSKPSQLATFHAGCVYDQNKVMTCSTILESGGTTINAETTTVTGVALPIKLTSIPGVTATASNATQSASGSSSGSSGTTSGTSSGPAPAQTSKPSSGIRHIPATIALSLVVFFALAL